MPNLRGVSIGSRWAEDAQTVIPTPPVVGVSYRNATLTNDEIASGQGYNRVYNSATYNEFFYRITELLREAEKFGYLPYSELTVYETGSRCLWLDGNRYRALAGNGPGTTLGVVSPSTNPAVWQYEEVVLPPVTTYRQWIPDYTRGIVIPTPLRANPYTIPGDGWVLIRFAQNNCGAWLYINNIMTIGGDSPDAEWNGIMAPVATGDTIYLHNYHYGGICNEQTTFFPRRY